MANFFDRLLGKGKPDAAPESAASTLTPAAPAAAHKTTIKAAAPR